LRVLRAATALESLETPPIMSVVSYAGIHTAIKQYGCDIYPCLRRSRSWT
jgi:hypothetical protein